jgi:MYXO-CTERM domain-containing protein
MSSEQDPDALREDIESTRESLGDTVDALAQKADVKGRVRTKVDERKEQVHQVQENAKAKARDTADQVRERPAPAGGIVAALLGVLGLTWLVRRRRRRKSRKGSAS